MPRRHLAAATLIALALAVIPITRDTEVAFGLELSTASCVDGGCGYWNPLLDCMCPDLYVPQYWPRCAESLGP